MADVGKLNAHDVCRYRDRSFAFQKDLEALSVVWSLTFCATLLTGVIIGFFFGYYWVAALLIGSLLASHTLLGFTITQKMAFPGAIPLFITTGATVLYGRRLVAGSGGLSRDPSKRVFRVVRRDPASFAADLCAIGHHSA
jgi:hypothetical protein